MNATPRHKIRLGVNIDHVATLRQLRAGTVTFPDILEARDAVIEGGADQITIHLRGDRRHIQDGDLEVLSKNRRVLLNLEMAATDEMIAKALQYKPEIVCLVPEKREELTTEGGLDVLSQTAQVKKCIEACHGSGIRVSLFVEPDGAQIKASQDVGADAVEFHTGRYALAQGKEQEAELKKLETAFQGAYQAGLSVHAGHGLDYKNIIPLIKNSFLEELNIGHSIVCRSIFVGLHQAVGEMKSIIQREVLKSLR